VTVVLGDSGPGGNCPAEMSTDQD